ncbi:MAG: polysaccharide biosynthesis protein, partial [Frateuria sp.]
MSPRKWIALIHPRVAVVVHDLAMAGFAWWIAKALRYATVPGQDGSFDVFEFPIVLAMQGLMFTWTGLYKGVWRFASLPDLWNILKAAVFGTLSIG